MDRAHLWISTRWKWRWGENWKWIGFISRIIFWKINKFGSLDHSLCVICSGSWNSSRDNFYQRRWIEVESVIDWEPVKESEKVRVLACESWLRCERGIRQRKCRWSGVNLVSRAELIITESFLQQLPWYEKHGASHALHKWQTRALRVNFWITILVIIGLFYRSGPNWSKRD